MTVQEVRSTWRTAYIAVTTTVKARLRDILSTLILVASMDGHGGSGGNRHPALITVPCDVVRDAWSCKSFGILSTSKYQLLM